MSAATQQRIKDYIDARVGLEVRLALKEILPTLHGEKGEPGERGEPGPPGPQGTPGMDGLSIQGPPGEAGERGEKGEQGERGEKGDTGERGDIGPIGEKGDPGLPGERGEKGEQGEKGEVGERGEIGPMGQKGEAGLPGERGEKGDTGERGEKGLDGADAIGIEDMVAEFDGDRTLTLRFHAGEQTKEFAFPLPIPQYRGVFKTERQYMRGDICTWGGSGWFCVKDTIEKPGTNGDWILFVKRGNDGKNGRDREVPKR